MKQVNQEDTLNPDDFVMSRIYKEDYSGSVEVKGIGRITVLDRLTGYFSCVRDTESSFTAQGEDDHKLLSKPGEAKRYANFWLASGMFDIRNFKGNYAQAIRLIKQHANICIGELKPDLSQSLATGSELNKITWNDFVERLRYDCVGAGVKDHCTADALFIVQSKKIIYGLDIDYSDKRVVIVICEESEWFSPTDYWNDLDKKSKANLNMRCNQNYGQTFMKLDECQQWNTLSHLPEHTVTGYQETWEYVNSHFTKDAAEAFIKRKKHDYRDLRVYVESQYHAWEFNAIKEAILSGKLVFKET